MAWLKMGEGHLFINYTVLNPGGGALDYESGGMCLPKNKNKGLSV